ncbi:MULTISPECIES: hypothetical protein [Actinoalloteichus]|uniref:Uncharacterized protein n=1 Tax=Actinoalloteichus fjordicus TaxID=1612552 RepID=A0AAC9PR33_9PSEU|nr:MULTISPECIES: hypothetical protein [Actinoalloteichus]APU13552.1 hypothetical protein UA74_07415 [Actinoalloteichus fjordicus]APU19501.1 hypothetical protein UA75_07410 [Actinoalloteichus sp. GBA129-24]
MPHLFMIIGPLLIGAVLVAFRWAVAESRRDPAPPLGTRQVLRAARRGGPSRSAVPVRVAACGAETVRRASASQRNLGGAS